MVNLQKEDNPNTALYYKNTRVEIVPLLTGRHPSALEIGCGHGDTLCYLKEKKYCDWIAGVELNSEAAKSAYGRLDFLLEGDIQNLPIPFEDNSFDLILCLDVLEHLVDPWSVLGKLHNLLKPNGIIICSIPNVRNFRVLLPLIFIGKWKYQEYGILDKTHLRFFTKNSAIELIESAEFEVDLILSTGLKKFDKYWWINLLTLNIFRQLFEFQYLVRGIKK